MLYESWKFHQDPLICWEVIGYYLTLCTICGCCKLQTLKISSLYSLPWAAYPCYTISYWSNIHLILWDQLWALVVLVGRSYKCLKICCNSVIFLKYFKEEWLWKSPLDEAALLQNLMICHLRWPSMVSPWWTLKLVNSSLFPQFSYIFQTEF